MYISAVGSVSLENLTSTQGIYDLLPCADPLLWLPADLFLIPEPHPTYSFSPVLLGLILPPSSYFSELHSSKPSSEAVSSVKPFLTVLFCGNFLVSESLYCSYRNLVICCLLVLSFIHLSFPTRL